MKKFLIILISLVLAAVMTFAVGCNIGTYTPPIDIVEPPPPPGGDKDNKPDKDKPGGPEEGGGDETEVGFTYTVTLYRMNDEGFTSRFYPQPNTIQAQWTGDDGNHSAMFDANGVATCKGLDGEYYVTLSGLPDGYTYDPNSVYADNDLKDINVELLPYGLGSGRGTGLYDCIRINKEGVFQVTLNSKSSKVYYEYQPQRRGVYTIESMADARAGKINPKMTRYSGQSAFKFNPVEQNDGGISGSYTKNFKWQIQVDGDEYVGNVWSFEISADTVDNKYPVTFYFKMTWVSDVNVREIINANGPFYTGGLPAGTFRWSYRDNVNGNRYYTDGSLGENGNPMRFRLWWVDNNGNGIFDEGDEGDGFYHFYSMEEYPDGYTDATGTYPAGYGPLLWTLIDGWDEIQHPSGDGGVAYPSLMGSRAFTATKNYSYFMDAYQRYSIYLSINVGNGNRSTGIHPVNDELMKAIQELATALNYFRDGDGSAETHENVFDSPEDGISGYYGPLVDSDEDHMWLIFCGYFNN